MQVDIVTFPETKVALIEHRGAPALEHETARKLIAWKLENRLLDPLQYRSYGQFTLVNFPRLRHHSRIL